MKRFIGIKNKVLKYKSFISMFSINLIFAGCTLIGNESSTTESQLQPQLPEVLVVGTFEVGEKAPFFETDTLEGERFSSEAVISQKAVVLDFWAGWCTFCVHEMPELEAAQQEFGEDLVIIGIHRTDTESVSVGQEFAQEAEVTYPLLSDDGSLYDAAGGIGMPVAIFIKPDGTVMEIKSGPKTKKLIQEKLTQLLELES